MRVKEIAASSSSTLGRSVLGPVVGTVQRLIPFVSEDHFTRILRRAHVCSAGKCYTETAGSCGQQGHGIGKAESVCCRCLQQCLGGIGGE